MLMEILIYGHVCIDKNTSEKSAYVAAGSPAMFMAKIFQQLPNCQTTIVAPYGKDFLPYRTGATFYPENPTGERTLLYENISHADGTREQKAHNRNVALPVAVTPALKELIRQSDVIIIAPLLPNFPENAVEEVKKASRPGTMIMLLPQGYFRDFDQQDNVITREFKEENSVLPLVDVVTVSDQDHESMTELAKTWVAKGCATIIVTAGEDGAYIVTRDETIHVPIDRVPPDKIVDSVGSGDIFSAGLAYRYHQTKNWREAVRFANTLARQCLFYTPDEIVVKYQSLLQQEE